MDMSRVARPYTVSVPHLFSIETYPTVFQMTSKSAVLRPDAGLADIFAALFPCGSITGAPKIKAMEIIAGLEAAPRGFGGGITADSVAHDEYEEMRAKARILQCAA